jgi:cytochrome c-type biogenesis protein
MSPISRWPIATAVAVLVCGAAVAAQHEGHGAGHLGPSAPQAPQALQAPSHYLTVNVSLSEAGVEPSTIFVPAGQRVQLMLRNRTASEHHYRVVGLTPDDLAWVQPGDSTVPDALAEPGHDHHNRQTVRTRATSPAGITPTGRDVHGYVTGASKVDVVLFSATQTGTFLVTCDLHPEHAGTLTVFEPPASETAALPAASGQMLRAALTRDLGRVDYEDAAGVHVEATYAPEDDQHVAILLMEQLHTANLPHGAPPLQLFVSGESVPLVDSKVVTDSVHHRVTSFRFARDDAFGQGHQVMTLRVASAREATWHLPLLLPGTSGAAPAGIAGQWGLILALLGGMVAAMWPCLFQLTVYFIPALAGVALQGDGSSAADRRRQVLRAAFFFILGFTLVYTATGALIGYAAQRFGDTSQFEAWQRYIGVAAGVVVIGLALRVAAKVRAPLVCRMPVLSGMARANKPAGRMEMMVAGLAFATGCMTCFGSALVVGMVVYIGMAQSALYGAVVLFLFSLGMGIPLVIAAVAMARALPLLMKLETAMPWMGLGSAALMAGFGTLLISGNYMIVSEWTYRLAGVMK